ncbi:protein VCF1-like [Arvicanthis niloticus]|uniref:protein VCF1-like n=1 Tax=Arvicanthis niloticus TaxID=61156 RepID=UPI00402BE55C
MKNKITGLVRQRQQDENEEDNHHPPCSKSIKKDQALQNPLGIESTSSDIGCNQINVNNLNRERVPENSLSQSTVELNYNILDFSQEKGNEECQVEDTYSHINNILREAHFYSLHQRRHT